MLDATNIRVGNIIRVGEKICKVLTQEIRGTGKFGKTVHVKLKNLENGNAIEKSFKAEEKIEDVEARHVKMQFIYQEKEQFIFMNMETYEQFPISAEIVGKHKVFLKENEEIDVLFGEEKALSIVFPPIAELKVTNAPPAVKGGRDSTYKEVELENGLKILVPQFVKEGEKVRVRVEDLTYLERVTTKSLG